MHPTFTVKHIGDFTSVDKFNIEIGNRIKKLYISSSHIGADLSEGFDDFVDSYVKGKLENLLAFIEKNTKPGESLKEAVGCDFVSSRGGLHNIFIHPFHDKKRIFHAVIHKGVIFLCEEDTEQFPNHLLRALYNGHKFEHILTENNNHTLSKHNTTKRVLQGTFFSRNLTDRPLTVFYSAEVDAVDDDGNIVEIKCLSGNMGSWWLANKSLSWYMQSKLANVEKIVVGERRYNILSAIHTITTDSIVFNPRKPWNLETCQDTGYEVLSKIKELLKNEGDACKILVENRNYRIIPEHADTFKIVPESFLNIFPN